MMSEHKIKKACLDLIASCPDVVLTTIGADGFSYTRPEQGEESMPEWKQGEYKLGHQL